MGLDSTEAYLNTRQSRAVSIPRSEYPKTIGNISEAVYGLTDCSDCQLKMSGIAVSNFGDHCTFDGLITIRDNKCSDKVIL